MLSQLLPVFMITFTVFVLFFLFMGVGYMVKKQPLKGSCGGVANIMGDEYCQFCGNDPNKCDEIAKQTAESSEKSKNLGKSIM